MPVGFRILPMPARPPRDLIDDLREMVTAHISDNMLRIYSVCAEIRPMHKGGRVCGPAYTVKVPPGDNLMVHKAIDDAAPGDVIMVDAGGVTAQAIIGELMSAQAAKRGVAGMVIDGAIRDLGTLCQSAFPVYARGITHRGPYKNGPGEINVPVCIGGIAVNPGDIVHGDEDGLVVIRQADARELLAAARDQRDKENEQMKGILSGTVDRAWVDQTLKSKGCTL